MDIYTIFIIISVAIVVITIIFFIIYQVTKPELQHLNLCSTNSDCPSGDTCKFSNSAGRKLCINPHSALNCDYDNLVKCIPGQPTACSQCTGDILNRSCVVVDDDHPYSYVKDGELVNVPNSAPNTGWCLPWITDSPSCNTVTSRAILSENVDNGSYNWRCFCRYPDIVTNTYENDDCNTSIACQNIYGRTVGTFSIPKLDEDGNIVTCSTDANCDAGEKCYVYKDDKNVCFVEWDKSKRNVAPIEGICECQDSYNFVDNITSKYCRHDTCSPNGKSDGKGGCICDDGYLECSKNHAPNPQGFATEDPIYSNIQKLRTECTKTPRCIPDPCLPDGKWDDGKGICVCKNTANIKSPLSNLGWLCEDLCGQQCPTSVAKSCSVITDPSDKNERAQIVKCNDCACPWEQDSKNVNMCVMGNKGRSGDLCGGDNNCCSNKCKVHFGYQACS